MEIQKIKDLILKHIETFDKAELYLLLQYVLMIERARAFLSEDEENENR